MNHTSMYAEYNGENECNSDLLVDFEDGFNDFVELESLIQTYLLSSSIRPKILFQYFLPQGYRHTTLSSVDRSLFDLVVLAKIHLGMIITLFDDLADHPDYQNPVLLSELYKLNVGLDQSTPIKLNSHELEVFELARFLFSQLNKIIGTFPNYDLLLPVLRFDINQFYMCNQHSELMSVLPEIRNLFESRILGPHNMGIVAAGSIDLMASPNFDVNELGRCREVFHLGQRLGRISNLIFTFKRELSEGDNSNEILIANTLHQDFRYRGKLLREFDENLIEIRSQNVKLFDVLKYADGMQNLHKLHSELEGRI